MNYKESKPPPPPIVIKFGDVWPTSEPLSAVLGTNVLWVQGSYTDRHLLQSSYPDSF